MKPTHLFTFALTSIVIVAAAAAGSPAPTGLALTEIPAPPAETTPATSTTTPEQFPDLTATVSATPTRGTAVQVADTVYVAPTTTLPEWDGPLPAYYGPGTECTQEEAGMVARAMWNAGANDDTVLWMLKTMSRESGCDPAAHNGNRNTGDDSWGLCQLNVLAGFFKPGNILGDFDRYRFATDFYYNAQACARLWTECGRGPWNYGNYYCRTPDELA